MSVRSSNRTQSRIFYLALFLVIGGVIGYITAAQKLRGRKPTVRTVEGYEYGLLSSLAEGKTDKDMSRHGFTEVYEYFFSPLKESVTRIFEIGVLDGGSLLVWRDYFPQATVYGIDIKDTAHLNSERIKTFIADQENREQLQLFIDNSGGNFDIIVDDGGHSMKQQQVSFGFLFEHVNPGGYYIIEDVHTSLAMYAARHGVEADESNTTLRMINNFIRNGLIESPYILPGEEEYLNNNIEYCNLFRRDNDRLSTTCIFRKKAN